MSVPSLSVILPNYNHADFLPRCIRAILSQSFDDFELVVVDDASTDGSAAVIEEFARRDPRVRFYRNAENRGVIYTLTRALELARADYVFGAASDDYILPGYFEEAMGLFRRHPQAGLCLGTTECVNDAGRVTCVVPGPWSEEPGYLTPDEVAAGMTTCGVPGPAIWKRAAFLEAGGYRAELRWHGDWFPLQVVAFRHGVCFIPRVVSVVRMVDESYSANQRRTKTQRTILQRLLAVIAEPKYRGALPYFTKSGVLRQFGPELVRAAATMDPLPTELLAPLREHVLAHAREVLAEVDPQLRAGAARVLGRYGREAYPLYERLGEMKADPDASVALAARQARAAIRQDVPTFTLWKRQLRAVAGVVLRAVDRFSRPLHHRRLENIELLLTELVQAQKGDIRHTLGAICQRLDVIVEAEEERRRAGKGGAGAPLGQEAGRSERAEAA